MKDSLVCSTEAASTITFDKVTQVSFWDSWDADYQLSLANVFLDQHAPDWDNPVPRTTTSGNYGTVCLEYPAICTSGYVYQIKASIAQKRQR